MDRAATLRDAKEAAEAIDHEAKEESERVVRRANEEAETVPAPRASCGSTPGALAARTRVAEALGAPTSVPERESSKS